MTEQKRQDTGAKSEITIRDLYPQLNEEQLREAEENLDRYLELVVRIYERIKLDARAYKEFKVLTGSRSKGTVTNKRSNRR